MRRTALALLATLAVLAGAAPAWAGEPLLTEGAGARFPDRAYALTLPSPRVIDADSVRVTENGRPVDGLSVLPADSASAYRFGVVLTIDASMSMRGRPLRGAIAAARRFVGHRGPGQPIAVLTFAGAAEVVQPFTTDAAAIDRALAGIHILRGNTHLFDAAADAVHMLRTAHISSGSVVLLSDGGDVRSATRLDEVTAAAKHAGARIFSVGLPSPGADFGSLNLMAAGTGGEFSPVASVSDLTRVFDRLGSRLGAQYLIRYRSSAAPGVRVRVEVRIADAHVTASTVYSTPALGSATHEPFRRSPGETLWISAATGVATSLLVVLLLGAALWLALRRRSGSARDRVSAYVGSIASEDAGAGELTGRMLVGAGRSLDRTAWGPRLAERLDIARISIPPIRLVVWVAVATFFLVLAFTAVGGPALGLLGFGVPALVWSLIGRRVRHERRLFCDQLPDNLQVIASAMRAGHSFSGAMSVVVEDAPEPTRRELQRVIADERLGVPVEEALDIVVRRMASKDLEQVALVAALQRETGGNTAEVLDRVTETVRDRLALRRMVQTLTAQGRLSRWVVSALPVALLAVISVINPEYVRPLYTTGFGHLVLGVAAVMVVSGSLVIKRIVDIKV